MTLSFGSRRDSTQGARGARGSECTETGKNICRAPRALREQKSFITQGSEHGKQEQKHPCQ
jgi:hypothetical protein